MAGFTSVDPCYATLLQGGLGIATTVTAGSPIISATNTFVANQPVVFSGSFAAVTGLTAGTTYYVSATGLSTSQFEVSATPGGTVITPGGSSTATPTVGVIWNVAAGVVGINAGQAWDTELFGVYIQFAGTAAALTINGLYDAYGNPQPLLISGETTVDYFWMPPSPIVNSKAAYTFVASVAAKVWVFLRAYNGPEKPETKYTS